MDTGSRDAGERRRRALPRARRRGAQRPCVRLREKHVRSRRVLPELFVRSLRFPPVPATSRAPGGADVPNLRLPRETSQFHALLAVRPARRDKVRRVRRGIGAPRRNLSRKHAHFLRILRVRRARPRRQRHGVGAIGLRRQRALRGAHGHPQHFLHIRGVRRARPKRHRHGAGAHVYGGSVPSGLTGIRSIFSTYWAFAALDQHGTVTVGASTAAACPGAHEHPQHFSTSTRSPRSTKTATSRRGGNRTTAAIAPSGAHGHPQHFLHILRVAALDQDGNVTAWGHRLTAARALRGSRASAAFSPQAGRSPRSTNEGTSRRGGTCPWRQRPPGAHGHPQHFLHRLGVRRARSTRQRHAWGD